MKIINGFLTAVFALFTYFQFNDPDPAIWVTWYGFLTLLTGFAVFNRFWMPSIAIGIGAVLVGLGLLFPEFLKWINAGAPSITESMKAESPFIEFVREFLGLVISLVVLMGLFFQARRMKKSQS